MESPLATPGSVAEQFRPIVLLLCSHTPENIDAAAVARQLQPRFRSGDFYVVSAAGTGDGVFPPNDVRKTRASDAFSHSTTAAPQGRLGNSVLAALAKIAAARREARQAAEDAKAAQLAALKADYMEDGLSAEDAIAAAQAELNGRSGSDNDDDGSLDDADNEATGTGRLPPCVCVLHVPLSVADVSRLAHDVACVAAVLLLDAACPIRELAGPPGAAGRKSSFVNTGLNPPGDRSKGRGTAASGSAALNASAAGKQQQQQGTSGVGGGSADDVVATFNKALAGQPRDAAIQNVLLHRVVYPTEATGGTGAGGAGATVFRASVPPAQFLSTVHAFVLRVLGSWVRYDAWRRRRALVQVPPYTPLVDVDAAALAAIVDEAAAATLAVDHRPSKRRSGATAGGPSGREESMPTAMTADPPTTPAQPRRMDEVAAEQFEYRAFMQRWCTVAGADAVDNPIAAAPAVQACLCACVCQVSSLQGPSTLRGAADTSAAQLGEDVKAACALCRTTVATAVGACVPSSPADITAMEEGSVTAGLECVADPVTPAPALDAPSVEAALVDVIGVCAGASALPTVSTALTTTPGAGDALHWLATMVVPRDQQGWGVDVRRWMDSVLMCLRQPAAVGDGVPRTQHTMHLLDCPTTFPRYFAEEDFLDAEGRHYSPSSIADDETAEEEEEEEEEDDADSTQDSASDQQSNDSDVAATATAATKPTPTARTVLPPAGPVVDHVDVIAHQLRRRRVLEQVRLCHTRPPVQELLCAPSSCRAVATETQWMEAKDGTVIEVARTAANAAQVGCRIRDADARVEAGFMLECQPASCPQGARASGTCAGDASPGAALPESMVASGVRGYLCVGQHLRVMTQVVADNERAVAQAAHAAAVAAAKEAAVAQYEAQFSRGGKATKSRDKTAPASQLTLEQITESLLAALPPLPGAADSPTAAGGGAAPPVMQVHASFPSYGCVMTATASDAGVPGLRVRCLPPSRFSEPQPHRNLLTVHLWGSGELTSVAVRRLRGVVVYLDGVAELYSPDLPSGVRLLLHRDGSYVAATERTRLLVAASGRCTLCEGAERGRVVRQLEVGLATAVTAPEVRRVEREDGHQLELVSDGDAAAKKRPSLTPSPLGRVRSIVFGPGVAVEQGAVGEEWRWRFDGVPAVYCDAAAKELALAVDEDNGDGERFAYRPQSASFALLRLGGGPGEAYTDARVAASLALRSCRLALFTDNGGSAGGGVFAVDCAYGGAVGRVGETDVYRVSPFGRCFEESLAAAEPRSCQLVLPAAYKRPRKRPAEAMLLAEFANPTFHRAVAGVGEDGDVCPAAAGAPVEPLHLSASAATQLPSMPPSNATTTASPTAATYNALTMPTRVPAAADATAHMKVRCVAVHPSGQQHVVLDDASWAAWVRWWRRHESWRAEIACDDDTSDGAAPQRIGFRLLREPPSSCALVPLTEAGAELPPPPQSTVQTCVLLPPPAEAVSTPQWCVAGCLTQNLAGGDPSAVAAAELATDGARTEVQAADSPLSVSDAALPSAPDLQAGAPVPRAAEISASPPASPPRHGRGGGGPLRYWTSQLAPPSLSQTPALASPAAAADKQCHSPAARVQTATPPGAVAGAISAAVPAAMAFGSAAGVDVSPSAASASAKSRTGAVRAGKVPLMRSYRPATDAFTGTNASSRYHTPLLSVQPQQVEFGNVLHGRRYVTTVRVTNTSTVPCRYRVRIAAALRPYLSASYARQFVAPGITTDVVIELAGSQPYGVTDSEIAIVHEGGAVEVGVWWCTTDETHAEQLGDGVECGGWMLQKPELQHPYQPPTEEERERRQAEHGVMSDSDAALDVSAI